VAKRVEAGQLVGAAEIAERLGLALPQTVHEWRKRHADFPQPVAVLRMGLVWYWPDVEGWAARTGRL
jgi:predicted DNA-binding transcriptional regulator AlpA